MIPRGAINGRCRKPRQARRIQRGFSLIEVMVALVIIAIGLLGVAGVLVLSANNNDSAKMQSMAAIQATSLAADMEENPSFWTTGPGATASINVQGATVSPATYASPVNCSQATCSGTEMAGYDLANWGQALAGALPAGTGNVACSLAPRPTPTSPPAVDCTIAIQWQENQMSNDNTAAGAVAGAAQNYTLVVQP